MGRGGLALNQQVFLSRDVAMNFANKASFLLKEFSGNTKCEIILRDYANVHVAIVHGTNYPLDWAKSKSISVLTTTHVGKGGCNKT